MLLDNVEITITAGHGGAGKVSFGPMRKSGPDGGNGGNGGDIYFVAKSDITLLNQFSSKTVWEAQNGENGGKSNKSGKNASDLYINLPIGTEIIDKNAGKLIYTLNKKDEEYLVAKGGLGGLGNTAFKSARKTTPKYAQPGLAGELFDLILSLKLIADFGLIGLPNAGKSSLLNELTDAKAKIANYAFTTLSPNLGVLKGKVIVDIPGLIEGASSGRGLGISFLKHIEKVKTLIHCISSESDDLERDYQTVRNELKKYNPILLKKKEVIVLTKSDIKNVEFMNGVSVSIYDSDSLDKLKSVLSSA